MHKEGNRQQLKKSGETGILCLGYNKNINKNFRINILNGLCEQLVL